MIKVKEKSKGNNEIKILNIPNDPDDIEHTSQRLIRSLIHAGKSLAMIPVRMLPIESRQHLENAGRELILGVASITREFANTINRMAGNSKEENDL